MPSRSSLLLTLTLLVALVSCHYSPFESQDASGEYAPVTVEGVEVTSTALVLAPGEEIQVRARPIYGEYLDPQGRPYPPVPISWTSSDASVVQAGDGGRLRAHRPGRITLTAHANGHTDTATVVVRTSPERSETAFTAISVGRGHACAVDDAGHISCWGSNSLGAVGAGDPRETVTYLAPVRIGGSTRFRDVAVGGDEISCGLALDGTALCWGGEAGQRQPAPVGGTHRFVELTTTTFTACGRTEAGEVFCWGRGFGAAPRRIFLPQPVHAIDGHCGLTEAGAAFCWSANGSTETFTGPRPFVQLSTGWMSTCALDVTGRAYCWGQNESGELGTGPPADSCRIPDMPAFGCHREPAPVLGGQTFTAITVGNRFACGLAEGGRAHCWGFNASGQLGTGGFRRSDLPVAVVGDLEFRSISAREARICGVTREGAGYCWGNAYLGDGRTWTISPDSHPTGTPRPTRVRNPL